VDRTEGELAASLRLEGCPSSEYLRH
jgi:hypothetical protein